ncbi:MAG TPA: carboxypeptidase regulatory-like domain-containing protein [Cyclobacteriaceae bacterium]
MKSTFAFFILSLIVIQSHAQREGIQGEVFWVSGNQMPGPGKVSSPQQGVVREIYIYEVTRLQDAEQGADGFFTSIKKPLVTKTSSQPDGSFHVKLPPGEYSLFVKEEKGLFANLIDNDGKINSVLVKPKKYSYITIAIDYEAVF